MNIEDGWRFMSADFSVQALGSPKATGYVTLVRSPEDKVLWHKMPEEVIDSDDCPPLYIAGHGLTLDEAIFNANVAAHKAKSIQVQS